MLMAIQLPGYFVIADFREIEKRNFEPWIERGALVMHGIEVPVDVCAVVEVLVAEQAKTMLADFICLSNNGCGLMRQIRTHERGALGGFAGIEKELWF